MIYGVVKTLIIFNLIYEILEVIFPISSMKTVVKSFSAIVMLYAFCVSLFL